MNKTIAAAALALGFAAAPTMAADLIIVDPVVVAPTSAYDWDGLYGGVSGGIWSAGSSLYVGGLLGVNFVRGDLLFGIEGSADKFVTSISDFTVDVSGRVGLILDNVVVYGTAGVGSVNLMGLYGLVGVGAEIGITDQVSLAGQVEFGSYSGGIVRGETSLRFHF